MEKITPIDGHGKSRSLCVTMVRNPFWISWILPLDPDLQLHFTASPLVLHPDFHQVSSQSFHRFLSNPANNPTRRHGWNITSPTETAISTHSEVFYADSLLIVATKEGVDFFPCYTRAKPNEKVWNRWSVSPCKMRAEAYVSVFLQGYGSIVVCVVHVE